MRKISGGQITVYAILFIVCLIMFYPFWYVLMFSFSDPGKIALNSYYFVPDNFTLSVYLSTLKKSIIYTGIRNSVTVTAMGGIISLSISCMLAYPLSRNNLRGKKIILSLVIFTMLFNGGIIPTYLVVKQLGLLNSLWALMLPKSIIVFNMMILIKFFSNLPDSLIESGKMDGASDFRIFHSIALPLSKSVLATVGLFYAVRYWNTFFEGMIYLNNQKLWPLQVVLRDMLSQASTDIAADETAFVSPENFKMATIIITMIPILCVYPFLQRYFTKGIMLGAVKG